MGNKITLNTISELLDKNFFIPSYQRGYRWNNQQVIDLLNDIYAFADKKAKTDKEFYCLQPIVIKQCTNETKHQNNLTSEFDNNRWYEVIDGQQRLTTIRILFTYLIKKHLNGASLESEYGKNEFLIEYETRESTKDFLNNIVDSNDNIDYYFISQAYSAISKWFEGYKSQRGVRENILRTLINDMENKEAEGVVQVIWYEIEDDVNPIETFIRINMGKIPLTNSELIKALFLQKRDFEDEKIAELRQIEIAGEWDKIEYSLQNDDFWWFLNKDKNDIAARIEFLFDLMFKIEENKKNKDEIKEFRDTYGVDQYSTFRFFNKKFSNMVTLEKVEDEWGKVKEYFLAFEEWFYNPIWHHYIGFLIYCDESIIDIYNLYKEKNKDVFTKSLEKEIKKKFINIKVGVTGDTQENIQYEIDLPFSNKNKPKIRELLLMLNIEFIVRQYKNIQSSDDIFIKFPFKLFKKDKWDIEHIDSYTTNPIADRPTQLEWLEMVLLDLNEKISEELKIAIGFFINNTNESEKFEDLYDRIIIEAEEKTNDEDTKNNIGNLTLLDSGTNRAYGNALFSTKRRMIIERDMDGKFIPICTKNIFLKYFDKKGTSRTQWTEDDINNYQNFIVEIIGSFLILGDDNNE